MTPCYADDLDYITDSLEINETISILLPALFQNCK